MGTALGCAAAGGAVGGGIGFFAPGVVRWYFDAPTGPFQPVVVGLGVGIIAGFVAGAAVVAVGLIVALAPALRDWRPFARGILRPSLSALPALVIFAGLGLAALRMPTKDGAGAWFGITALALTSATLAALGRPPHARGVVAGFAVFGWAYFLLSLWSESTDLLPTTHLLDHLGRSPTIDAVRPEFRRIGHSLLTWVFAALGGVVGELGLRPRRPPGPPGER
jgi:hypothetical protein